MSDKAKYYRDMELFRRQTAALEARKKPEPVIRCQCGHTIYETEIWSVADQHGHQSFRCLDCWPEGIEKP